MVYWKGERCWLGKRLQDPEVMTQGETIEELEENLRDAYRLMVLADVPDDARVNARELSRQTSGRGHHHAPDLSPPWATVGVAGCP